MKGKLSDHPLAELIREISTKGLSGTLRLDHDRARSAIYFERGTLVFAASNLRDLRLREYLSKNKLVSKKELSSFGANGSDIALARSLSTSGALTKTQADGLLGSLVTDVLRVTLLWTEGNWEFDERTLLGEDVSLNIDTATLMREAAQRLPLKFVGARFRNPAETFSRGNVAGDQAFLQTESFILSRLDQPTQLEELVAVSGLRELDALRTIYGLALSGVIKRQHWQAAFREAVKAQTPVGSVETASKPQDKTPSVPWTLDDRDADLEQFLQRVENVADYYEILDLTPNTGADQIKDVYYTLARRYHPDRFHLKSGTSLHSRLSAAFAKATQAYEVLNNSTSRAAYDATLERKRQFAGSRPSQPVTTQPKSGFDEEAAPAGNEAGQAEYNFKEGFGALQQGLTAAALTHLAAAARLRPGEARYRAYYGRALAASERTRRLAENEMQAAVRLEPSSAVFRTLLAELYFDLKFHKRAQTELSRALAIDPDDLSARLLQRKMDRSKVG